MHRASVIIFLSVAAALSSSSSARAQGPWLKLGDFGQTVYLDTTSVVHRSADVAVVDLRLANYVGAGYDRLETDEVDCKTRKSRVTRVRIQAVSARAIGDLRAPAPDGTWHAYTPGSFGAVLLDSVCAYLGRPPHTGP
jgi:Surface-adhesin protein E